MGNTTSNTPFLPDIDPREAIKGLRADQEKEAEEFYVAEYARFHENIDRRLNKLADQHDTRAAALNAVGSELKAANDGFDRANSDTLTGGSAASGADTTQVVALQSDNRELLAKVTELEDEKRSLERGAQRAANSETELRRTKADLEREIVQNEQLKRDRTDAYRKLDEANSLIASLQEQIATRQEPSQAPEPVATPAPEPEPVAQPTPAPAEEAAPAGEEPHDGLLNNDGGLAGGEPAPERRPRRARKLPGFRRDSDN